LARVTGLAKVPSCAQTSPSGVTSCTSVSFVSFLAGEGKYNSRKTNLAGLRSPVRHVVCEVCARNRVHPLAHRCTLVHMASHRRTAWRTALVRCPFADSHSVLSVWLKCAQARHGRDREERKRRSTSEECGRREAHGSLEGCFDFTAASSNCLRHPACPFIAVTPLFEPDIVLTCLFSSGTLLLHTQSCQSRGFKNFVGV
jgi:hypothetical protein